MSGQDVSVWYHASHEQHRPGALLDHARRAAEAGFDGVSSSDHVTPWNRAQGESGFAWSWLGAALATTEIPFGVVNAPGQRYHPVVIAQAIATLLEMFPDRLTVAFGSGEASNEHITGDPWPAKAQRHHRLEASVDAIRALLRGEEVSLDGPVRIDRARLWTLPTAEPRFLGAALTEETARWCGRWADGLLTLHSPTGRHRQVIEAFRDGGGAGKPVVVQVKVAWARDEAQALAQAHEQWRTNVFESKLMADLELVSQFEAAAAYVRPEDLREHVLVSAEPEEHIGWLREVVDLGVDVIALHQVPRPQAEFIDVFASEVLPEVRR